MRRSIGLTVLLALVFVTVAGADDRVTATSGRDRTRDAIARTIGGEIGGAARDTDGDRVPDAVETAWGLTDPLVADTDHDAIPDGAEDADGDGLSAAGEARYRTDPTARDSDGDGIDDWHDDADGDGRPDGPWQDSRPVPPDLVPSLADAGRDRPRSYRDGCHQYTGSRPIPCVYGVPGADRTVVLLGDSHAAQWLPGLEVLARRSRWRIVSITRSSCPVADVTIIDPRQPDLGATCDSWRRAAIDEVGRIGPDLVVVANLNKYDFAVDGAGPDARWDAWGEATRRSLRRIRGVARRVVLLGESPHYGQDAVPCLIRHRRDISRCSSPRSRALHAGADGVDARAAAAAGVDYRRTGPLVCPYDPCPVIIDDRLLVFDTGHLNATTVRALAPGLRLLLRGMVGQ